MKTLRTAAQMRAAADDTRDPTLKGLILLRMEQLSRNWSGDLGEIARFHIVEPGDYPELIERELGFSMLTNIVTGERFGDPEFTPSHEWLADHGSWFEVVFMFTDDFGTVVLVPDHPGVEFDHHAYCLEHAGRPC
jgi:hypothetical protein